MSEHSEQAMVMDWARKNAIFYPELGLLFAIPNGAALTYTTDRKGRRYSPQAQRLKAEGMTSGVPDLCLPVARQEFHGMFIELKVGKNKPTPDQARFLDVLAEQGYYAAVCWSGAEAIGAIRAYLGI